MATTTNYGWTTPDDTALVKDGASAIRSLGSAVDSTLKTQIDAQIAKSLVDAKGDILTATADNTPARLAVGTNGQVLQADSTTATGLKWATMASGSLTLLSTTSLSGATTTVSGISTSYRSLQVHIYGVTNATANGNFRIAPNGTTNITRFLSQIGDTASNTDRDNQSTNDYLYLVKTAYNILRTDSDNYWVVNLPNYADTTYNKTFTTTGFYTNGVGSAITYWYSFGKISTTSAITSLQFSNSGGNLSTGTVLVYGVN